jgi:hypothetical protein
VRVAKALSPESLSRWRADPAGFIERYLIDPKTGEPFELLEAERWFLKFALTLDGDGRLRFPELLRRLFDELVPVPTQPISCRLVVSHAGFEGEGQLLQELYARGLALPEVGPSLHAGDGLLMAWHHEPIAPWQDEKWLADMRRSLRPNQFLRMICNKFVSTETNFIDLEWWDRCVDPDAAPRFSDRAMPVWVGVDASVKRDSTAIVVVTFDRQTNRVVLVEHYIFQPTAKEPLSFELTIERTLRELVTRYAVRSVHYDPYQMASTAQRLQAVGVPMREFPQTVGNLTEIGSALYSLIKGRGLAVYRDAGVRLAISRTIAIETPRGWRIAKEKAAHKIDVVVALAMACHAAVQGSRIPEEPNIHLPIWGGVPRQVPGSDPVVVGEVVCPPGPAACEAALAAAAAPQPSPAPAPKAVAPPEVYGPHPPPGGRFDENGILRAIPPKPNDGPPPAGWVNGCSDVPASFRDTRLQGEPWRPFVEGGSHYDRWSNRN